MSRVDPRVSGYLVHAYTASTLIFVTLAAQWIVEGHYRLALLAMAVTILIDATDGTLARKYRVEEFAARIDGSTLDNIVDFLSYVFLPMLFILQTRLLLEPLTLFITFVMFASAFGFSRTTAKLADKGFFVGFPSYWNIVVFYLFLLRTPALFNTVLVVALALLVFVPVRFLYVSRLRVSRYLHFGLSSVWGVACLWALALGPGAARDTLLYISLVYPAFYTGHSLLLDILDRSRRPQLG